MVMRPVPWQTGEICGPESAKALTKPAVLKRDLTKAKSPLLIVGSEAVLENHGKGDMIDYAIALSNAMKMPVIATGGAIKAFLEKGPEVFSADKTIQEYERRIAELEQLLGKKEVEIALLKNFLGQSG